MTLTKSGRRAKRKTNSGVGFQAVALAASTGVAQLIVALLYIFCARGAGPETFGLLVAAIALGTAAVGFLDFGTNSYWVREMATGRMTPAVFGERLASKVGIAALLSGLWAIGAWTFVPSTWVWIAAPIAFTSVLNQSFQVSLRSIARGDLVSLSIFCDRLVALLSYGLLALAGVPLVHCLWLGLSMGSIAAAATGWLLTPTLSRPQLKFRFRTNPWKSAGHFGLANMAVSAQTLDTPIMSAFGGPGVAGIYGAVARWTQPMGLLANAFSSAAAPHMARAESGRAAWQHIRRSLWLPIAAVVGSAGVVLAAPLMVHLLVGDQYRDSISVLQVLALGTIPAVANQPLFVFLQARRLDKLVSILLMSVVVLQLVLVAILSTWMGAIGAAWAAGASQLALLAGMLLVMHANRSPVAKESTVV